MIGLPLGGGSNILLMVLKKMKMKTPQQGGL